MIRKSWLASAVRVFLAIVFVLYGAAKLAGLQFAVSPSALSTPFGEATPYSVAWYFFHLSPLYHNFIGAAQVVTGVLLLVPRTGALGALCFLTIILNIVVINFGYDLPADVKVLSLVLLAFDGLLIKHYAWKYRLLLLPDGVREELLDTVRGARTTGSGSRTPTVVAQGGPEVE